MPKFTCPSVKFLPAMLCGFAVYLSACSVARTYTPPSDSGRPPQQALPSPEPSASREGLHSAESNNYRGRYVNPTFGFSVVIPEGLEGKGELEGQPQHGFVITLSAENSATLAVTADYNAALWRSLDEAFEHLYGYAVEHKRVVTLVEKTKSSMDDLPAIRFTTKYVDDVTQVTRISSEIVSIRKCLNPDVEVLNTIVLDTSEARFAEDSGLMEGLRRSWKRLNTCH